MIIPDRIAVLFNNNLVTGIDFIYVYDDQGTLDIYFLETQPLVNPLPGTIAESDIRIYSPGGLLPEIKVDSIIGWSVVNGKDVLQIKTAQKGDFSLYKLKINDARIDRYFNDVTFSFKANCPSDLDCRNDDHDCPPEAQVDFPVDYNARDFWSYRKALLDFAAVRYPDWHDRLEADAGVMMAELMSALGDEMAYYQDRVNREAYLETATQRRSIRRHARLVDYHMYDAVGAKVWMMLEVDAGTAPVPAGLNVFATGDDDQRINFEIGKGIIESVSGKAYAVNTNCNSMPPHQWDEDDVCLPAGSTELYLEGLFEAELVFDDFTNGIPGKFVLLQTKPSNPAQAERAQVVRVTEIKDTRDEVLLADITRIAWEEPTQFEMDLTCLKVHGNILPATAGLTIISHFVVDKQAGSIVPAPGTVNRQGHDETSSHFFSLPGSHNQSVVCLKYPPLISGEQELALPEIMMEEVDYDPLTNQFNSKPFPKQWSYKNTLAGIQSSSPSDRDFTLDDGYWTRVRGFQKPGEEIEHFDYAMDNGKTIRFGDGEFGKTPDKETVFRVWYRLGGTRRSNVAAATINSDGNVHLGIASIINPLPASGGADAQTPAELRQLAPEEFRAITHRAVRPEDYAEAAERLPWVQKAGGVFRWTGSWLTAFVTPDPKGKTIVEKGERKELRTQLNRFRQAGREVNILEPEYADIDLKIDVCVNPDAYPGQVKERIYEALTGKKGFVSVPGYFSPDRYTFGTLLERSSLEAAIQSVAGVRAVEKIKCRRRGYFDWKLFPELSYDPGVNTIIRISNDPLHPERGTINIYTHGGL